MSEVSRARLCLLDPKKKAQYDQQLQAAQEQLNAAEEPAAVEDNPALPEVLSPPPGQRTAW